MLTESAINESIHQEIVEENNEEMPKSWLSALRLLWRPMFFSSLLLHVFFLNLPLPPEPVAKSDPEKEIKETVKVTSLVAAKTKPKPKPPAKKVVKQIKPAPPPAIRPPVKPKAVIPPPVQPSPIPQPTATPVAAAQPVETPTPTPSSSPEVTPSPEAENLQPDNTAQVAEAGSSLLEVLRPKILARLSESTNDPLAIEEFVDSLPYDFVREEQQAAFFEQSDTLKPGVFSTLAIPQTNPTNAYYDYLEPILQDELAFTLAEMEQGYGEADLYRASNDSGVEFYISLVKLKGSGAFFVLWQEDPRKEANQEPISSLENQQQLLDSEDNEPGKRK